MLSPGDDTSDKFEEMLLRIRRNVWSDGVLPVAIARLLDDRDIRSSGETRFRIALTAAESLSILNNE